jgi:phage-related minor tail protein
LGGENSFKQLAKTILEEFAKIALKNIFSSIGGAKAMLPFFGARAAGGAVNPGGAYLVGENGPEWFTPRQSGAIAPSASAGAVNVHFHFAEGSDATSVSRHQGQIAAQVARAVAYGRRNL